MEENPHQKLQQRVDAKLGDEKPTTLSPELKKVKENLQFVHKIASDPIKKDEHSELVFGAKLIDPLPVVYGDNIWNRSIFTVDELCDLHDSATLQQRLKYRKKRRSMDSKMGFIIILIVVAAICMIVLMMALGVI